MNFPFHSLKIGNGIVTDTQSVSTVCHFGGEGESNCCKRICGSSFDNALLTRRSSFDSMSAVFSLRFCALQSSKPPRGWPLGLASSLIGRELYKFGRCEEEIKTGSWCEVWNVDVFICSCTPEAFHWHGNILRRAPIESNRVEPRGCSIRSNRIGPKKVREFDSNSDKFDSTRFDSL